MSKIETMALSVGQRVNVEGVEAAGHDLTQVSATMFHCEGCDVTSHIGDATVAQPFDKSCGVISTDTYQGVYFF